MPDHLHLVLAGMDERADFQHREMLWQESYFDHVLRDDEQTITAVKYVLENPVRKGMVGRFEDYLHSGSDIYTVEQLQELWRL